MDAMEIISGEVRDLIRTRGIDPRTEPASARQLVSEVIADYDERTLRGRLPLLADPDATLCATVDGGADSGSLQKYFDDPEVEEVQLNSAQGVFISDRDISELTTTMLIEVQVYDLIERTLRASGRRLHSPTPCVDAMLPGSRACAPCSRNHPGLARDQLPQVHCSNKESQ